MTKREAIVKDIIACLKTINIDNGYQTNAGNEVQHWWVKIVPEDNSQIINVKDREGEFTERFAKMHNPKLQLDIEFGCCKKKETYNYLMKMYADIYLCIGKNIDALQNKYRDLLVDPGEDSIELFEEEKIIGEGCITIFLTYSTKQWLFGEPEYPGE